MQAFVITAQNGKYWAGQEIWTSNPDEAKTFDSWGQAFTKRRMIVGAYQIREVAR